jgi:WASH complex subunit 7
MLEREQKWFRNWVEQEREAHPDGNESHYLYSRAKALEKEIRNLEKYEDESTLLDKLRNIITSIGNALGFVRLLRSASLNYSSKSVQFLPIKVDL